jgi:hypothetical protein
MPRVNRDLQRRLDARRERERRRPAGERRYQFTSTTPLADVPADGPDADSATQVRTVSQPVERSARVATARPAPRPYSAYAQDYAYVLADLKRVAVIYGGLLLALILLFIATQR